MSNAIGLGFEFTRRTEELRRQRPQSCLGFVVGAVVSEHLRLGDCPFRFRPWGKRGFRRSDAMRELATESCDDTALCHGHPEGWG